MLVQREVGERLIAGPGDEHYGPASVRVAYRATGELVRRVPPSVFWPRPRVASVVVRLDRLAEPPVAVEPGRLWRVVDAGFAERRKTIRSAVRPAGRGPRARGRPPHGGGHRPARPRRAALPGRVRADRRGRAVTASPRSVTRDAPAKLNVFLRVLGAREDGYHELESLVLPLSLADLVTVTEAEKLDVVVDAQVELSEGLDAGGMNLALMAALAMAEACGGLIRGAEIRITKRIPVAAGLGGGSADAAATLLALNELWGGGLSRRAGCRSASTSVPMFRRCWRAAR